MGQKLHWRVWQSIAQGKAARDGRPMTNLTKTQIEHAKAAVKGKSPYKDGNHNSN